MLWRIEVATRPGHLDVEGHSAMAQIRDFGIGGVTDVAFFMIYDILAEMPEADAKKIAASLLADPVLNDFRLRRMDREDGIAAAAEIPVGAHVIQVSRKPGVTDPVEASVKKAVADMGLAAKSVKTVRKYVITGSLQVAQIDTIAKRILANEVIEDCTLDADLPFQSMPEVNYELKLITVDLLGADDDEMLRISREGMLALNLDEMRAIRDYFKKLRRNPTDCELATVAQTWSEHCKHKVFTGLIDYNGETIDNLLKSTIRRATEKLDKPWCLSVFKDNAGVIDFDGENAVCFKVETHNHPSAIEPYGGANTGIGGVIRDPLGTGLGAKPIINTDVFCFGPPDLPADKLPKGTLHPKRIMKGVVAGVRDYGNRMGIPTTNGALYFDERYVGNPLVYCGNCGIMPADKIEKAARPGDLIVAVGGKTGRDGIGGATFSSIELNDESETTSSGAVQIGNAIVEKTVVDTILQARDLGLYSCITDCGAGGFSSAVGEMGADIGAEVELSNAPLKYHGLTYTEIWISEAQERMVISVPPDKIDETLALFAAEDVEATVLGKFTDDKMLRLKYEGKVVCELDMDFLHEGTPRNLRKAVWAAPKLAEPEIAPRKDYGDDLKKILGSWNVCSKEWVIRQYDHEVQAGSIVKPLVGATNDGPGDASVTAPVAGSNRGIILSNGMNPCYGDIDPYWMAASAIDEALRNVVAVGGSLERVALLDNFSWGNPEVPERLGALVRAARACHDYSLHYGAPFISGKDSLFNEYESGGRTIVIPHSLLISAIAVMPDVKKALTMDFKNDGNLIYVIGLTRDEMGGSHFYRIRGEVGANVPKVYDDSKKIMDKLAHAIERGRVASCHDCSEGGLAVALAEMAFAGGLGALVDLGKAPTDMAQPRADKVLFSESNTRFVCEVAPDDAAEFEMLLKGLPVALVGEVVQDKRLTIECGGEKVVDAGLAALKDAWQAPLRW